ncbi:MAG: rhodanese-like domain-containing protein [Balneolaceae bacterium]
MSEKINEISTYELMDLLGRPQDRYKIIDIRPIEAYNGWKLKEENRGGHLPGAKSIPLKWTQYLDWVEVLEEKNVHSDDPVIVYGYTPEEAQQMAGQLVGLGFEDVLLYNHFVDEWAVDPGCPLEQLEKYKQLVYPRWLYRLINHENPEGYEGNKYVICHAHYGYPEDYERGHIPGALSLDTNTLESTETWNRRSPEELQETLQGLGIRFDNTVIVYGRFSSPKYEEEKFPGKSAGHLGAIRCAAILLYAGVEDVRILNGGVTSWEFDGYELSTEANDHEPVSDFGVKIPAHPEYMIDTPEAREYLESDSKELVSIRSWKEFIGERSGYHYIDKKGRIPGAVFGNCGSDAYHMENYRNFDHTMREYHEIADAWREGGIVPEKKLAFYCGTGWRGSEAFMNAYLMGWPDIAVYDGGWFEWSHDPANSIETGEPVASTVKY